MEWVMQLPLGVSDPMFTCELALEMGKSIQEMTTGEPGMTAHELCVIWPTYLKHRNIEAKQAESS